VIKLNILITILFIVLLVAIIVFLDFQYLKEDFRKRLIVNILIVLAFAAFYMLFFFNLQMN
jgi:hypothetical protein